MHVYLMNMGFHVPHVFHSGLPQNQACLDLARIVYHKPFSHTLGF